MNIRNEIYSLRKDILVLVGSVGLTFVFILDFVLIAAFTSASSPKVWSNTLLPLCGILAVGSWIWTVICLVVYVLDSISLLKNYDNSSGLHSWTELPKREVLNAWARLDDGPSSTLSILTKGNKNTCDTGGELQYFHFELRLPSPIQPSGESALKFIILDHKDELLHKDAEAGVIVLLPKDLVRMTVACEESEQVAPVPFAKPVV